VQSRAARTQKVAGKRKLSVKPRPERFVDVEGVDLGRGKSMPKGREESTIAGAGF
jgi:hypothetical protein